MFKLGRTFAYVGDRVVPNKLSKRNDFTIGEVFEVELPDAFWIICDGNDDKLICVRRSEIEVVDEESETRELIDLLVDGTDKL